MPRVFSAHARAPQSVDGGKRTFHGVRFRPRTKCPRNRSLLRMGRFRWNEPTVCRLSDMENHTREQQLLWEAATRAIGRALKHDFECEQQNVPDRIQQLLAELEAKGRPERED